MHTKDVRAQEQVIERDRKESRLSQPQEYDGLSGKHDRTHTLEVEKCSLGEQPKCQAWKTFLNTQAQQAHRVKKSQSGWNKG